MRSASQLTAVDLQNVAELNPAALASREALAAHAAEVAVALQCEHADIDLVLELLEEQHGVRPAAA